MILIFILAVQSRWLLILNPHHHCTILTVSGNLKAKIRFSNKWFFKNILLRKQQWENYTKISANPIINFTTALSLYKSREKNVYNCLFWHEVALLCVSVYANVSALGHWSFISLVSGPQSPVWPQDSLINVRLWTLSLSISLKHSHTYSFQPDLNLYFDWNIFKFHEILDFVWQKGGDTRRQT